MDENLLQVDHRVPYEVAGEQNDPDAEHYMLLSPSANRAKSWTCEHCDNWERKDGEFCVKCFWAYPEDYEHIAGKQQRVIYILFTGDEVDDYKKLVEVTGVDDAQSLIKSLIKDYLANG